MPHGRSILIRRKGRRLKKLDPRSTPPPPSSRSASSTAPSVPSFFLPTVTELIFSQPAPPRLQRVVHEAASWSACATIGKSGVPMEWALWLRRGAMIAIAFEDGVASLTYGARRGRKVLQRHAAAHRFARTALSPRAANCSRATNAERSRSTVQGTAEPDLICPCPSARRSASMRRTRSQSASTHGPAAARGARDRADTCAPRRRGPPPHPPLVAIGGHRVIGAAVDAKVLARQHILDGAPPLHRALAAASSTALRVSLIWEGRPQISEPTSPMRAAARSALHR